MADENKTRDKAPDASRAQAQGGVANSEIFLRAQEKIRATDVWGDKKTTDLDSKYQLKALAFVRKESLSLPDDRFQLLVEKITEILKRKDIEKANLEAEFRTAREEVSKEIRAWKQTQSTHPSPSETAEETKVRKVSWARSLGNAILDKTHDRYIIQNNFDPKSWNVEKSANYLEYVSSTSFSDFRNDVEKSPERVLWFCKNWWPQHPVYVELVARKERGVAQIFDELKRMYVTKYDLAQYLKKDRNKGEEESMLRTLSGKMETEKREARLSELRGKVSAKLLDKKTKASDAAEYLAIACDGTHPNDAFILSQNLRANPEMASQLVFDWNADHPTYKALQKDGSAWAAAAMNLMKALRLQIIDRVGLPVSGNDKKKRAEFESILASDAEFVRKWNGYESRFETTKAKLRAFRDEFARLSKAGDTDGLIKKKRELVSYCETQINPLVTETKELSSQIPEGSPNKERVRLIANKIQGSRLAVDNLLSIEWDQDFVSLAIDTIAVGSDRSKNRQSEREMRIRAFEDNLEGKLSVQSFSSKEWGNTVVTLDKIEAKIQKLAITWESFQSLNSNEIKDYLKTLYSIDKLNAKYLSSILKKNALKTAYYYGIRDGKVDRNFLGGESRALRQLLDGTKQDRQVAQAFQQTLLDLVNSQISSEKIKKDGYPALKEYMEEKGQGDKFEKVRQKLDAAKDGMDRLDALFEALGPGKRTPEDIDKFLNEELPRIQKNLGKDSEHQAGVFLEACMISFPPWTTLREAGITPKFLRLKGEDAEFLGSIFTKKVDDVSLEETERVLRIVKKTIAKSASLKLSEAEVSALDRMAHPLGNLISSKKAIRTKDVMDVFWGHNQFVRKAVAASLAAPDDAKKRNAANVEIRDVVRAKELERTAAREERAQNVESETAAYNDAIAKALGFAWGMKEILSSETNVARVYMKIGADKDDAEYKKLPGYLKFSELIYAKFVATYARKSCDREIGTFMKKVEELWELKDAPTKSANAELAKTKGEGGEREKSGQSSASDFFENRYASRERESSEILEEMAVGTKFKISQGYGLERTATGVSFDTPEGKFSVDGKAAEWALTLAKTLHKSGADFLISYMREIASSEGISYKDGQITNEDEKRLIVFMAEFFWVRNFDKSEPDHEIMREKFVASTANEWKTLSQKAREIWIVTENGSLSHAKFRERLKLFGDYRNSKSEREKAIA